MKINKSVDVDLNILSPQKHIRIHEGDVDSVDILIGVSVDDETVDLDGITIKYDATINNYLAEQDADGSVVDDKISIPVTQNMTAMSGLLLIDVRMIQSDQILFTQTICATVEKAVVNGSTYIDLNKITIIQRMNALEEKMDYIEELVENFDTSKLIVSTNRPPSGAPAELDVDLLRVGDTWILSGASIVYKLVEAQYNYQPVSSAEPYHKFTWQPLNERYGVGNTEPPTTVTYQAVIYTINEVQWSWLPVPEYFKGDHFQMQIGVDDPTYYICKSASMPSTGVCTYTWREEGGSIDAYTKAETNELLADKMDLAPLNPTAEQIAALPVGQVYGDTANHKGTIKGGQSFYDSVYIDENYRRTFIDNEYNPPYRVPSSVNDFQIGDMWVNTGQMRSFTLVSISTSDNFKHYNWKPENIVFIKIPNQPQVGDEFPSRTIDSEKWIYNPTWFIGDIVFNEKQGTGVSERLWTLRNLIVSVTSLITCSYKWQEISIPENTYTKNEIDTMIGDIETLLSEV